MESLEHIGVNGREEDHFQPASGMVGGNCSKTSLPDVLSADLQSLALHGGIEDSQSILLMDHTEQLSINSPSELCARLGCDSSAVTKVVAILGKTGEGKSHTLNQTFFCGEEVFPTSAQQTSCTSGVWAAFEPSLQAVILDTEGMLGTSENENVRTRMLLKVLAVSDVVIYRSRAVRLHNDMFYFLGDAATAYNKHFQAELNKLGEGAALGPTVVVFQETQHTDVLVKSGAEEELRQRFSSLQQDISAFSRVCYVGTKTESGRLTDFVCLRETVGRELSDQSIRSPRPLASVLRALTSLNAKFSGSVTSSAHTSFPDEYFTCSARCQACEARCSLQMRHTGEHSVSSRCQYSQRYENKIYTCQRCQENGRRCVVVPKAAASKESSLIGLAKFAWSGFVLECNKCGVIYRSRQQWYGNPEPEHQGVVATEIAHVWPGVRSLQGTHNAARRVLDSVTFISGSVSEVSSAPAASIGRWAADQVAPGYWRPNADIINCNLCNKRFGITDKIHHCRACGEGFCSVCSNYQRPVPDRGWGYQAVRVCKHCYSVTNNGVLEPAGPNLEPNEVQVRRVGETVYGTVSSLATALEFPINMIKHSARPDYWVPDTEISECSVCDKEIGITSSSSSSVSESECRRVHHCRQCGQGVCNKCSATRRPVPTRGWDTPVRVCDNCLMLPQQ